MSCPKWTGYLGSRMTSGVLEGATHRVHRLPHAAPVLAVRVVPHLVLREKDCVPAFIAAV
eukprot:7391813-Prymnesium_polylepis.6